MPLILTQLPWAKIGLIAAPILLLALIFGLSRCGKDNSQAEQTTRSGEAVANSAGQALGKYGQSVSNESQTSTNVSETNKEISSAKDRDAQRRAVLKRVCAETGHRNDPACKLR